MYFRIYEIRRALKALGRQNPYGIINLYRLFHTDNVKHELGRDHFVTPDSKADIFLVKERITYPHDRFEEKLIYYPNQFVFSLKMQNSRSRKGFSKV